MTMTATTIDDRGWREIPMAITPVFERVWWPTRHDEPMVTVSDHGDHATYRITTPPLGTGETRRACTVVLHTDPNQRSGVVHQRRLDFSRAQHAISIGSIAEQTVVTHASTAHTRAQRKRKRQQRRAAQARNRK